MLDLTNLLKSFEYDEALLKRNSAIIFKMYAKFIREFKCLPTVENIEDMIVQYNMGAIAAELNTSSSDVIVTEYERLNEVESAFVLMDEFIIRTFKQSSAAITASTFSLIEEDVLPASYEIENGKVIYNDCQNVLLPEFIKNGVLSQGLNFNIISRKEKLALGGGGI